MQTEPCQYCKQVEWLTRLGVGNYCSQCGRVLRPSKLAPTGDASRDRLVAARLALRSTTETGR